MCLFFKFPEKLLFGRVLVVRKFLNDCVSYISIRTQLRAHSLEISSYSGHICRSKGIKVSKNRQKCIKLTILILLHPGIFQGIRKLQPFTKFLRLTLLSMWNSALREKFNFCFSSVKIFILAGGLGTRLSFYGV